MHGQCDILELTAERNTALHVAAEQGHHELIRELYLRFRDQGLLSRQNSALDTPMHCAARAGHARAVAVLVELAREPGENILGCKNEAGDTALHLAARHGHGAAVEVLVSAAAQPAAELNNAGVSPLYLAVISGSVSAVRAIITKCKDASSMGPSAQNALHAAVFQSSEMVHLLLEWRPALADQVDCSGSSPLHFASSDGDRSIVRAILRAGPPGTVYKKDSSGLSALHVAARMGHHRVVTNMLGSCPDAAELRDGNGETFVHAAAREKRSSVVSLATKNPMLRGLLDAQDREGNTPLHLAVAAGSTGIVEDLLRNGKVRANVPNNDGHTAFDLAAGLTTSFFKMVSLVVALVAYGAQLRPQRQDQLEQWVGRDIENLVQNTSDNLAVVAGLIVAAAFAAGFNLPGGYGDDGKANLKDETVFKSFLLLNTGAVVTSIVAVILLVYGKASRSAGSWKSFAAALHLLWVSLVCMMLAFQAALLSVATTGTLSYGLLGVYTYTCILVLQRDGDEEEEQGPRASYSGERRWGAAHRKWRQHGWDTLPVNAVGIKSAIVRSLRRQAEGGIKERRECSLDEEGVRADVSPKGERREGVQYGDEGEDQERTGGREKEKRTVHEDGGRGTMSWTCKDRVLMGPTPTASAGTRRQRPGMHSVVELGTVLGT
ncbi:ankyrin repeat-containing protein NPR4-like [Miscanthus floridulus]|uniref:ankyrin repeat-containing protein NPR4-like n=1 Tax=Miscanthus floridulus TaxID=154761 RepID=UPI003459F82F